MTTTEAFLGTARRWRPSRFDDVVGQEHITDTLRNAIEKNRIASAYIFSGPRGIGKTTTARILAKALNCEHRQGSEPDNICDSCMEINQGSSLDIIEIDGASNNSVDDVRTLREGARYAPVRGAYKMYIIDEVHMLSTSAFNALLKTLEEPPPHLIFVLATTEISRVPATILSRCQRFDFRRMQIEHIILQLKKIAESDKVPIEEDALVLIAKKADGAMRDALGIFDQIRAFSDGAITASGVRDALNIIDQDFFFRATDVIHAREKKAVFEYIAELMDRGIDIQEFVVGLIEHLRNLLFVSVTDSGTLIETTQFYRDRYSADSSRFTSQDLLRLLAIAIEAEKDLRFAPQPRVALEFALLRMASLTESIDLQSLLRELGEQKKNPQPVSAVNTRSVTPEPVRTPAIVAAGGGTPSLPKEAKTPEPPVRVSETQSAYAVVEDTDITAKWQQVVASARERRIKCWSTLEYHTSLVGVEKNVVTLACAEEFHRDSCRRSINDISAITKEVFGNQYSVAILEDLINVAHGSSSNGLAPAAPSSISGFSSASYAQPTAASRVSANDPIAELLARELGAEELP